MKRLSDEIAEIVGKAISESNEEQGKQAFDMADFNEFSEIRY